MPAIQTVCLNTFTTIGGAAMGSIPFLKAFDEQLAQQAWFRHLRSLESVAQDCQWHAALRLDSVTSAREAAKENNDANAQREASLRCYPVASGHV